MQSGVNDQAMEAVRELISRPRADPVGPVSARWAPPAASLPIPTAGAYATRRRPNWFALTLIVLAHAGLLAALVMFDVVTLPKPPSELKVIALAPEIAPPPPAADPDVPPPPVDPVMVAPVPVIRTPVVTPPPVIAAPEVPPVPQPRTQLVASTSAPASTVPVGVDDLATKMVSGKPPRYPIESRRHHEQGTVVLAVTLALDGSVADVRIAKSSGFDRLDRAARDAVLRWKWRPTVRGGQPVQVRGIVDIPFVLQG